MPLHFRSFVPTNSIFTEDNGATWCKTPLRVNREAILTAGEIQPDAPAAKAGARTFLFLANGQQILTSTLLADLDTYLL